MRPRRPNTARSATPSWTSAPASCRRPTGRPSTASCAPRPSRSCARPTSSPARRAGSYHPGPMLETILSIVQVGIAVVLIFLVLMHSGKDAGLSGAFGVGTGSGPLGGGSLVERNLNRWTVAFAVLFFVNTIILLKIG